MTVGIQVKCDYGYIAVQCAARVVKAVCERAGIWVKPD